MFHQIQEISTSDFLVNGGFFFKGLDIGVLMCIHCICPGLLRMTRLIWSHSQLNVPSGNISTFLRLKSIAIIFLRPSYTHTQCTHWDTCTRTHGYLHFFLFQLPFNLIGICVACCPLNNWLWMCTSVRNETICSFLDAHRISFSYSRLSMNSLIVLPPILLICGSFFLSVLVFWKNLYTSVILQKHRSRHTHASVSILPRCSCKLGLRDGRHSA